MLELITFVETLGDPPKEPSTRVCSSRVTVSTGS